MRGLLEYLLVSSPRGSAVEARVDLATGEADAATVTILRRRPDENDTGEQTLDWSRVSPAVARRIVADHGGFLEASDTGESLSLVATFPRKRGVGADALPVAENSSADLIYLPRLRMAAQG